MQRLQHAQLDSQEHHRLLRGTEAAAGGPEESQVGRVQQGLQGVQLREHQVESHRLVPEDRHVREVLVAEESRVRHEELRRLFTGDCRD